MASSFEFELVGLEGVLGRMKDWSEDLARRADDAVSAVAASAAVNAQSLVRVDTRDLQESIESHRVSWGHASLSAGAGLGYATRVEALDPFFEPSIEQARDDLRARILRGFR